MLRQCFQKDNEFEDGEADGSASVTPLPPDSYSNHDGILKSFANNSHHPIFGILIEENSMYKGSQLLFVADKGSSKFLPHVINN